MFDLIKELTELVGPVGQEAIVLDYVENLWKSTGLKTERTRVGNLLARLSSKNKAIKKPRKLLLAAHGDELCYLVRAIDERGFLMLANGQTWTRTTDLRNAFTIGSRVKVLARTGVIPGVIAAVTGHMASLALSDLNELTWNDLWVDTGLSHDELIQCGVTPGTRIVWDAQTVQWGDHIVGKALDDRVPIAVMTELAKRVSRKDLTWDITLACTVQEEIGTHGAFALGAREQFDAAIILEIGLAGDVPGLPANALPVKLGGGPTLVHKDAGIHYDHALTQSLERCAAAAGIPIQHAVFGSFASDGRALFQHDIPPAMICFPARYTHTPFETAHIGDIAQMVDWLYAFVTT